MTLPWERLLQTSNQRLRRSEIRDLLAVTARPDVINFAGGLPAQDLFPVDGLRASVDAVLRDDGPAALQYGPTEGYLPLRRYLSEHLQGQGIDASPDEILITNGSQQGLSLLGTVLLESGAPLVIEAPSYVGALQAFAAHAPRYLLVPLDAEGISTRHLADLLTTEQPQAIYSVATFQNPSGVTMNRERRQELLHLSNAHGVPIIEDDPYGALRYEGESVPPLRALPGGNEVIYLGTFSKVLAPGLRVGWVVAPAPVMARLVLAKQGADLHTDSLSQRIILHYVTHNDLDSHVTQLRTVYRARRDAMLAALERFMPREVTWTRPQGGLFVWLTLPIGTDSRVLLRQAIEERVAFVPGTGFYPHSGGENALRLSFSHTDPARIAEGIERLSTVLATHRAPVGL